MPFLKVLVQDLVLSVTGPTPPEDWSKLCGKAVATLHRARVSTGAVLLLILAVLIAIGVAVAVSDTGSLYLNWIVHTWHDVVIWAKGLFS